MTKRENRTLLAIAIVLLIVALTILVDRATAIPDPKGCDRACVERVKARHRAALHARHERALAREMRRYKAHQMPWCTWGPESSGPPYTTPAFAIARYRALNPHSWAGGKFQIIPSTWRRMGGQAYAPYAHQARPVYQERVARRIARRAGIRGQWVNC